MCVHENAAMDSIGHLSSRRKGKVCSGFYLYITTQGSGGEKPVRINEACIADAVVMTQF